MKVEIRGNNIERGLQVLKRKLIADGLFKDLQSRRFFEKPSECRRRLKRAAIAREKRRTRTQNES